MNNSTPSSAANQITQRLQRTIGLAIGIGSILSAGLTFAYRVTIFGYSILDAAKHDNVWFTAVWIPIGFYTAFSRKKTAQWVQTYACLFFACAGAFSADQNELTSLVYFGIGVALGIAYDVFSKKPLARLGPAVLIYLAGLTASVYAWTDRAAIFIILWVTGVSMVCVMYWALGKAALQEVKRRKSRLEEQIHLSAEALEKAEALRDRNATLLKELHHRTKNSLQIVASLLSIQQEEQRESRKSVDEILGEAERRVRTMAKTHEIFHRNDGVSVVEIEAFVKTITEGYLRGGLVTSLHIETDGVKDVAIEMDVAIPLGLIINELFSNIVKHAYAHDLTDRPAWVFLRYRSGVLTVGIEDHGIGIPESVRINAPESGGLRIVQALADQIDAELSLRRDPFTTWIIRTPLDAGARLDEIEA